MLWILRQQRNERQQRSEQLKITFSHTGMARSTDLVVGTNYSHLTNSYILGKVVQFVRIASL